MSRSDEMFNEAFDPDMLLGDAGRAVEYVEKALIGHAKSALEAFPPTLSGILRVAEPMIVKWIEAGHRLQLAIAEDFHCLEEMDRRIEEMDRRIAALVSASDENDRIFARIMGQSESFVPESAKII